MTARVVFGGDSITAAATRWPFQWLNQSSYGDAGLLVMQASATYYIGNSIIARNMAISGTKLNTNGMPDMVPIASLYIDSIVSTKQTGDTYVFSCSIGTNDGALGGLGSTTAYAAAVGAACLARKSAGFDKVIICTLIPRGDGVLTEPNRASYNSIITGSTFLSTWSIDAVADFASDSIMGLYATTSNATYYDVDTVHPTAAGSALLAPHFTTAMQSLGLQ